MQEISPDELVQFCRCTGFTMKMARLELKEMEPKLRSRVLLAAQVGKSDDEMLRDPIEADEVFGKLIEEAAAKAEKNVAYDGLGACQMIWAEQARILKEEHAIDWYSPAQMNPWVMMD
jgi:hypothetical protein